MMRDLALSACVFQFLGVIQWSHSFSFIERHNLFGVWKLQLDPANTLSAKNGDNILIKIQEDGSFQQCNEDWPDDGNWLHGCWAFEEQEQELKVALDKQCTSQDVLLSGKVTEDDKTDIKFSVPCGTVQAGKFMYPMSHASFFEIPMAASEKAGKFSLEQVFGFSLLTVPTEPEQPANKFKAADFHNKKFFMTFVPIEAKTQSTNSLDNQNNEQPVDIRAMPIDFFPNGTFAAMGMNKILRGRFEVTDKDMLRFHVSRFGTGRSAPGSVYSEGTGLSHEDERTYIGTIEEKDAENDKVAYRVGGTVYFGNDLGPDIRPEPVGEFLLNEVDGEAGGEVILDYPAEGGDDIFDSVFE